MKSIRVLSFMIVILAALIVGVDDTLASWYARARRTVDANGITALISTPNAPLYLVEIPLSGESNWVSTYDIDQNGKRDWLQAGWKMYHWHSIPKQYVEWCIDCIGDQGTYEMKDQFATQSGEQPLTIGYLGILVQDGARSQMDFYDSVLIIFTLILLKYLQDLKFMPVH
jgi:hypothetical protein